jgi:hypothetical protein
MFSTDHRERAMKKLDTKYWGAGQATGSFACRLPMQGYGDGGGME